MTQEHASIAQPEIKKLAKAEQTKLLAVLKERFHSNRHRHPDLDWDSVEARLLKNPDKLWSLSRMEATGGEPDVIAGEALGDELIICDCVPETPAGRRNICYDPAALASRKNNKPENSALGMAQEMGIELMDEAMYRSLQKLEPVDQKTSSWLLTPERIRQLGGGLFGDRRYDTVFTYHNGAESYYGARGFRGLVRI